MIESCTGMSRALQTLNGVTLARLQIANEHFSKVNK